ncbi:MAG: GAF domain-containing sensor histidine kinase [Sulfitobacter sp.]|jgi:signal transduction histidine kinase|uniref:sensor histidine kinase n=1 Tax=Sulfitobacter sp. SK025 TaxID=1389011 RepID=UPI000E0B4F11|nr:GAF domain-containing sensor histidine kinase [Sulfitobacter sp. SK025]AXI52325.1 histidine kinase [Sulfitobacter sp. SK025]MCP3877018.1 GAF domain-containing sensor histidine kinase [Sulfitobacter sp.]
MRTYPIPFNEEARLRAVFDIPGLTAQNEALFDTICEAARTLLDCPIAHISVVEEDSQWYKSVVGMHLDPMPKDTGFCAHTIMSDAPMIVPDLSKDARFERHPMVAKGGPEARYYAGVPLILSSGHRFGSLCALDLKPHEYPSEKQIALLTDLGRIVVAALERSQPEAPEVQQDKTAQSTFLTLVGHELRTPLTVLFGSLKLLEVTASNGTNPTLIHSARRSVDHLTKLIETILSYSNASTGELRLNEQNCDLGAILSAVAGLQFPTTDAAAKTVTLRDTVMLDTLHVDAEQIELAVTALVLNAVMHGGTDITLETFQDMDGNIEISVRDNGSFDDHVELAELYKPFVVGGSLDHRATKGGLGLGLPLTRKLVEMHGGDFEVHAEADHSRAVIRLPAWRCKTAMIQAAKMAPATVPDARQKLI